MEWPLAATISVNYETKYLKKIIGGVETIKPVIVRKPKTWVQMNTKPAWLRGRR